MRGKDVVTDVLNRRKPEYIPLGTYAIDCDTVERLIGHKTYVRNKVDTPIALWEGRRDEVCQSLKEDSVELFKKLPMIDVIIPIKEAPLLPPKDYSPPKMKKLSDDTWEDSSGCIHKIAYQTNEIAIVYSPPRPDAELAEPPEEIPARQDKLDEIFEVYDYFIANMSDRYIFGTCGGFQPLITPGGMEKGLMEYYLNPELIKKHIAYDVKCQNSRDADYIRPGVDGIFIENDFGMTKGTLISPNMFREFCFPAMKERIAAIKKYRDKVMLHSCGNNRSIMDMLIEAGIDGYQSLQANANMDIDDLIKNYGDRICFFGGVSVDVLLAGTPDEVRREVRLAIEAGRKYGGFILGPSHSIAYGTKYDNFMAMLDEHDKLKYTI